MRLVYKHIMLLVIFFIFSLGAISQEKIESKTLPTDHTLYDLVLFSESISTSPLKEPTIKSQNDDIFIAQVGEGNSSNVNIVSRETSLSLAQFGDENFTSINVNVKDFEGDLLQNGNRNYSATLAHDPNMDLKLGVKQNGNQNHFISHGTNSIGSNLQLNISGDQQTIIVRNFK